MHHIFTSGKEQMSHTCNTVLLRYKMDIVKTQLPTNRKGSRRRCVLQVLLETEAKTVTGQVSVQPFMYSYSSHCFGCFL